MTRASGYDAPIDASLVRALLTSQFPRWSHLPLAPVIPGGWDHRSFRLGDDMVVRLPSAAKYATQVEREHRWLPILAPRLPLAIPQPLALGEPGAGFPWRWAIRTWIPGETAAESMPSDLCRLAQDVADFLGALHAIDARDGPPPGHDNFFRGGPVASYDGEARRAIRALAGRIDSSEATRAWEDALASKWKGKPMWVHGDVSAGNLLVREGRLHGVIDFGSMAIGDPACDLAIAWTVLTPQARAVFRSALPVDEGTWKRGRGWALWKASIVAAGIARTNGIEEAQAWPTLARILAPG